MDHRSLAPVILPDTRRDEARICHEIVYSPSARIVPKPHVMRRQPKNTTHQEPHAAPVFRVHLPDIPHWRVAVAYVAGLRGGDHSLCRPGFRTDHQVISTEIKLF